MYLGLQVFSSLSFPISKSPDIKDSSSQSILSELKLKEEEIKSLKDVKEQEHKSLEKVIEEKQKEVDSLHSQTDALESQTKELQEVADKFNHLTVEAAKLQETVNSLLEEKEQLNIKYIHTSTIVLAESAARKLLLLIIIYNHLSILKILLFSVQFPSNYLRLNHS